MYWYVRILSRVILWFSLLVMILGERGKKRFIIPLQEKSGPDQDVVIIHLSYRE